MIKVTYEETVYECARAVKGVNYIRLYDAANNLIVDFEGVSNSSLFTIAGGEWEAGKSTQRVAAFATLDSNSAVLELREKVIVEDGLTIYFDSPANSDQIETIDINGRSYAFANIAGIPVCEIVDCFCAGSKVEIILSADGTAYLQNGASIKCTDYVVERGVDGIWEYEKWYSGKAVCWCSYSLKLTLNNAWGAGNAHFYDIIPSQNFPTDLFIERPKIEVHSEEDSGNTFVTKKVTTKDITGEMYCVSPNTLTDVTVYVDIEAKGKWK